MTDIARYEDLVFAVGEYLDRSDLVDVMPRLVGLAELRLNRSMRTIGMRASTTITPSSGVATLPSDFAEVVTAYITTGRPLRALTERDAAHVIGGQTVGFVVRSGEMQLYPPTDSTLTLIYYKRIPALTTSAPTNWLLTLAPDLYLWSTCVEAATHAKLPELGDIAEKRFQAALADFKADDYSQRWSNARVRVDGHTP